MTTKEKTPTLVGYSLSLCVQDIIEGRKAVEDVVQIQTGTKCWTVEDWEDLLEGYTQIYWTASPSRAMAVVMALLARGQIIQPRIWGGQAPDLLKTGVWGEWKGAFDAAD